MAKEQAKKDGKPAREQAAAAAVPAKTQGSGAGKALLIVGLVLLVEAATVGLTIFLAGGPSEVEGQTIKPDLKVEQDRLVEVLVVKDQFPNQRTGRVYLYDTEIYVTVRNKDSLRVKDQIDAMQATLSTDIAVIFRRAEPTYLLEPALSTLTRQVKAALDERVGRDAEGQPVIQEVLIRKCIQFRTES